MASSYRYRSLDDSDAGKTSEESGGAHAEPAVGDETELDPFTVRLSLAWYDYLKIGFNALWLFPLRLLLIILPSVLIALVSGTIISACDKFNADNPKPLKGWSKFIIQNVWTTTARMYLFGFGFQWIHTTGKLADTADAPVLVVAPHSCFLDMWIAAQYHVPAFVAKSESKNVPLFGWMLERLCRLILVSREDSGSRARATEEIQRRAHSGGDWPRVLVFAEGTTTNRKVLLNFKRGGFLPKLPVQGVVIKLNNKLNTMIWGANGVGLLKGLFFTLCQFHNSLEVEFLPVHHPSQEEMDDTALFTENVRQEMSKSSGIPTSDYTVEDVFLMREARRLKMPFASGMVVCLRAHRDLGLDVGEMKTHLRRFAAMDRNKDGFIVAEDLADYLGVPCDACLQAVFNSFKLNQEMKLSFRNYLYGVVELSRPLLQNEEFLQSVFEFFDQDGDGIVTVLDLSSKLPISKLLQQPNKGQNGRNSAAPTKMDYDSFQAMLKSNSEYLILFHECQNAGFSAPSPGTD